MSFFAIIALVSATVGLSTIFREVQAGNNQVDVSVRIEGLRSRGSVTIVGGLVQENGGEMPYSETFKVKVDHDGVTRLPVETPGTWEVHAAASEYGEIPEGYNVTVKEGERRVLDFKLGRTLPRKGVSVPPRSMDVGMKLSYIGRISAYQRDGSEGYALQGMDGNFYYKLDGNSVNLKDYTDEDLWISGVLANRGPGDSPPVLKVTEVVRPGKAIRTLGRKQESPGESSVKNTESPLGDRIVENNPQFVTESPKLSVSGYPPGLTVADYGVAGLEGKIDNITTPGETEWFFNFDLKKDSWRGRRDHAATMLFYEDAEVDKVKDDIYWGTSYHSVKWMFYSEPSYSSRGFDSDKGSRETEDPFAESRHIRLYAPYPEDRFYNGGGLGYFVVGTTLWDQSSEDEEDCEESLCDRARDKGYTVYEDYNYVDTIPEGNNNGWISAVRVP